MKSRLTNGDAVGPSSIASSSIVKGIRGMRYIRTGIKSMIITGKPIAAIQVQARVSAMVRVVDQTWTSYKSSVSTQWARKEGMYVPIVCVMAKVAPKPTI